MASAKNYMSWNLIKITMEEQNLPYWELEDQNGDKLAQWMQPGVMNSISHLHTILKGLSGVFVVLTLFNKQDDGNMIEPTARGGLAKGAFRYAIRLDEVQNPHTVNDPKLNTAPVQQAIMQPQQLMHPIFESMLKESMAQNQKMAEALNEQRMAMMKLQADMQQEAYKRDIDDLKQMIKKMQEEQDDEDEEEEELILGVIPKEMALPIGLAIADRFGIKLPMPQEMPEVLKNVAGAPVALPEKEEEELEEDDEELSEEEEKVYDLLDRWQAVDANFIEVLEAVVNTAENAPDQYAKLTGRKQTKKTQNPTE